MLQPAECVSGNVSLTSRFGCHVCIAAVGLKTISLGVHERLNLYGVQYAGEKLCGCC
jgi:hypothetical protein